MNSLIETINLWGERFLSFAGPMLWQSSLLILVVFAVDSALRKKLRASVRYALWLVVLVKLLLPPALALPTSLAWWVRPAPILPAKPPVTRVVVTYADVLPTTELSTAVAQFQTMPSEQLIIRPALSRPGWLLLASSVGAVLLLLWMFVRWWQVSRLVKRAILAPELIRDTAAEAMRLLSMQRKVNVRVTEQRMSPAVCGLFRATILLPRSLAEQFTPEQLRAVLLHELIHLRRGDVWLNCAQALIQIVYWWHPLLWVANARIRRVREEAVDDAVMLTLRADAETYAPTLLEVAKLAFNRPLASLGLVGILESKSALRQRVERLVHFKAPRKVGLTLLSVIGIAVFAAIAGPMGGPPPKRVEVADASNVLSQAKPVSDPNISTTTDKSSLSGRQKTMKMLDSVHLEKVEYWAVSLPDVLADLSRKTRQLDPEQTGVNFITNPNADTNSVKVNAVTINLTTPLYGLRLAELLDALVQVADQPIKYSIEDSAVVFSLRRTEGLPLYVRTFKFDVNKAPELKKLLAADGIDVSSPAAVAQGKGFFYSDGRGELLVRATATELDATERALLKVSAGSSGVQDATKLPVETKLAAATNVLSRTRPRSISEATDKNVLTTKFPGTGKQRIFSKLQGIRLDKIEFQAKPLDEVIVSLQNQVKKADPEKVGLNFLFNPTPATPDQKDTDIKMVTITIDPPLNDVRVVDALEAIVKVADKPITYRVRDYAIEIGWTTPEDRLRETRAFKADPNTFRQGLEGVTPTRLPPSSDKGVDSNNNAASSLAQAEPGRTPRVELFVRSYSLDPNRFYEALEKATKTSLPRVAADGARTGNVERGEKYEIWSGGKPVKFVVRTNDMEAVSVAVRKWLDMEGVDMSSPQAIAQGKSIFWGERSGLLVRATGQDLDAIEKAIYKMPISVSLDHDPARRLLIRTFKVDPNTFYKGLEAETGHALAKPNAKIPDGPMEVDPAKITESAKGYFTRLGVDWDPALNKSIYWNDRAGELLVRATSDDLDVIQVAIQLLNRVPQSVNIKAKFVEVEATDGGNHVSGWDWGSWLNGQNFGEVIQTNSQVSGGNSRYGVLNENQTRVVMQNFERRQNVDVLSMPEVTTVSGRQARIQIAEIKNIVTATNSGYQTTPMSFGPVFDVIPYVMADGYSVQMTIIATVKEFLGYDDPGPFVPSHVETNAPATQPTKLSSPRALSENPPLHRLGETERVTTGVLPLPRYRTRQITTSVIVRDGQTLVLGGPVSEEVYKVKDKVPVLGDLPVVGKLFRSEGTGKKKKNLLVFVTPTLLDPAGNRLHAD